MPSGLSADGRRLVFRSSGTGFGPDVIAVANIYVRDLGEGRTLLASCAGGAPASSGSETPAVSADGRRVAFSSQATNLRPDGASGIRIVVFVRDLEAGTTRLASRADGADGAAGDGSSQGARLSGDGRHVAFSSAADNLSDADGPLFDAFARDLDAGTTRLVGRAAGPSGTPHAGPAFVVSISADGRYVSFLSNGPLRDSGEPIVGIFRRDVLGPPAGAPPPPAEPSPPAGGGAAVRLSAE